MKVSREKAAENREAILDAAAAQIRERGLDQISVAEVARAAGLTHGALYSHFASKELLKAAATARAFDETRAAFSGVALGEFLERYLSAEHRDDPGAGCPNAALVSDAWRQPEETRKAFAEGLAGFVELAGRSLEAASREHGRDRAVTIFAAMVGGLALARAVREVDEARSDDILRAVSTQLERFSADP